MMKYYHLYWQENARGEIIGTTLGLNRFLKQLDAYREKDENYSVHGFVKFLLKKGICAFILKNTPINF